MTGRGGNRCPVVGGSIESQGVGETRDGQLPMLTFFFNIFYALKVNLM